MVGLHHVKDLFQPEQFHDFVILHEIVSSVPLQQWLQCVCPVSKHTVITGTQNALLNLELHLVIAVQKNDSLFPLHPHIPGAFLISVLSASTLG